MQKTPDFLATLLNNPIRAELLRILVLNAKEGCVLTDLAKRVKASVPAVEKEIKSLLKTGLVKEELGEGKTAALRKKARQYFFNTDIKYANALSTFIHAVSPEQFHAVEKAVRGSGRLTAIVLSGVFIGDSQRPADLIVVGENVNEERLEKAMRVFEPKYGREIRYVIFSTPEFRYRMTIHDKLVRDTLDYPHRVLLNKHNLI